MDIGCGRGEITLTLDNSVGIDIKKYDEWKAAPKRFKTYNGTKIPFDKRFDTIIFNNSFEHVAEKKKLVNNLKKKNKNAKVIIVLPTTKYLIERYFCIPRALFRKILTGKGGGIHLYLVHETNIYGWNFLKEFAYYLNWRKSISPYFEIHSEKTLDSRRQKFYICSFK